MCTCSDDRNLVSRFGQLDGILVIFFFTNAPSSLMKGWDLHLFGIWKRCKKSRTRVHDLSFGANSRTLASHRNKQNGLTIIRLIQSQGKVYENGWTHSTDC